MERYIAAILFGILLVLAGIAEGGGKKDKTLDPNTCQQEGTCWIPAGGEPQPILKKVKKDTFNAGYVSGKKFLIPGTQKGDLHLLWLAVMEEWYGPWCLYYQGGRSYYKCLQSIKFESGGNPFGYTGSTVWTEIGLTSAHPDFAEEYDFAVCGDSEVAIWAASRENMNRREWIETGKLWKWLADYPREEKEWWLGAGGSMNASVIARMAKDANAHKVDPEMSVTPSKRFIGALRKWDKSGVIYAKKVGISITPKFMGIRLGRKEAQRIRYPMISWRPSEKLTVHISKKVAKIKDIPRGPMELAMGGRTLQELADEYQVSIADLAKWNARQDAYGMCYGSDVFYDPEALPPMPTPKKPFPGHKKFGKECKRHKDEWRNRLGRNLKEVARLHRGNSEFEELQAQGYFPPDELYDWWEENIGHCRVSTSPLLEGLLHKLEW